MFCKGMTVSSEKYGFGVIYDIVNVNGDMDIEVLFGDGNYIKYSCYESSEYGVSENGDIIS